MSAKDNELHELKGKFFDGEKQIQRLQEQLVGKEKEAAETARELEELNGQIQSLRQKVEDLSQLWCFKLLTKIILLLFLVKIFPDL